MDNKKSYVYKITCLVTGEYYFGSSFNANSDYYWGTGRKIKERIAQYGKEHFVKEILGEFDDRVEAHKKENQYIEQFRNDDKCLNQQLDRKFGTYGEESREKIGAAERGDKNPMYGKHLSDETRAKISAALRGKTLSEEHKARMSAAFRGENNPMYGKHHTDETRVRMSVAQLGKNFSEEHRAKLSAARRGKHWRKNPVTGKREYYD